MIRMNEHYTKLQASYLFSDIAKRIAAFTESNPDKNIIKLGIGDVTRSLPPVCIDALHKAVDEMAQDSTFRGYGPEQGYAFLREAIAKNDYADHGVTVALDEIFVSDGSKCDSGNIQELFAQDITVAIPDPVYPVYVDTNVMAGRSGAYGDGGYAGLVYLKATAENGFVPKIPEEKVDLIYLCFPNNPTGATVTKEQLAEWVAYAKEAKALILYDAAYVEFIRDTTIPRSIFEVAGAKEVAVEFRSFSKTAGFTGTRCAYTIVPKECKVYDGNGAQHSLNALWNRRHTTKFNGVSYPVQRAAEAIYSTEGKEQVTALIDYYMNNASHIREQVEKLGFDCVGGVNSPYVWIHAKEDSWSFFDQLLNKAAVVCTPGIGFGKCGDGYVRLSAFNSFENVKEAMERLQGISG